MRYTIELTKNKAGQWGWKMFHRNGKQIGGSTETYKRSGPMLHNLCSVTGVMVHRVHRLPDRAIEAKYGHEHVIVGRIQPPIRFTVNLGGR